MEFTTLELFTSQEWFKDLLRTTLSSYWELLSEISKFGGRVLLSSNPQRGTICYQSARLLRPLDHCPSPSDHQGKRVV